MNVLRSTFIGLFVFQLMTCPAMAELNWDLFKLGQNQQPDEMADVNEGGGRSPLIRMPQLPTMNDLTKPGTNLLQRWNGAVKKLATKTRNAVVRPFDKGVAKLPLPKRDDGKEKQAGFWEKLTTPPQDPQKPKTINEWLAQPKPQ